MSPLSDVFSDFADSVESAREYGRRVRPPRKRYARRAVFAIVGALVLTAALTFAAYGTAHAATHRAVSLADASAPPTVLAILRPHHAYMPAADWQGRPCGLGGRRHGYFSDVSAYRWNGSALGPQRWDDIGVDYWQLGHGRHGRVTYDGLMWRNESRATVLVAGWCES